MEKTLEAIGETILKDSSSVVHDVNALSNHGSEQAAMIQGEMVATEEHMKNIEAACAPPMHNPVPWQCIL